MDKVKASKLINKYTGGDPDIMFCHRVHVQTKLWGGFWLPLSKLIDVGFYLLRRQRQHVRSTYLLQRRKYAKGNQKPTRRSQETPSDSAS